MDGGAAGRPRAGRARPPRARQARAHRARQAVHVAPRAAARDGRGGGIAAGGGSIVVVRGVRRGARGGAHDLLRERLLRRAAECEREARLAEPGDVHARALAALASDAGCFNTSAAAAATLAWLDANQTTASGNPSSWGWTWTVFQVQYYDMPRKPGVRIEAPDTLGRKCWAFAYLDQRCDATARCARARLRRRVGAGRCRSRSGCASG